MRHLLSITILIGLFVFSLTSRAEEAAVERYQYYAGMPFWESPLQPFLGQLPLTKQQAETRIHVRVGYDKLNRLVSIQRRLGNHFKETEGRAYELYVHSVNTQIRYTKNKAEHSFYDRFGNRKEVMGKVWTKVYHMDDYGRFSKLEFKGKEGQPINNSWGTNTYLWQYSNNGAVIETRYSLDNKLMPHRRGFEFERIRMYFASNGHLSLMQNIDEQGNLKNSESGAAQYKYYYDNNGMFSRWEIFDSEGNTAKGPTGTGGEYYVNGIKGFKTIAFFNPQGEPDYHASDAVYWYANYDHVGNITELWFTDKNNAPVVCSQRYGGYAKVKYTWDKQGQWLQKEEYLDTKGNPMNNASNVSQVVYERHQNGQLKEIRFLDENKQSTVNTRVKGVAIQYSYDNSNQQVSRNVIEG